jgi:hypothetical protein
VAGVFGVSAFSLGFRETSTRPRWLEFAARTGASHDLSRNAREVAEVLCVSAFSLRFRETSTSPRADARARNPWAVLRHPSSVIVVRLSGRRDRGA